MAFFNTLTARNEIKSILAKANLTFNDGTNDIAVPIIYPNIEKNEGLRPRIEMELSMSRQVDNTLKGDERLEERGLYEFRVCVELGSGEALALELCTKIQALYPSGSYITIENGVIQIPDVPSISEVIVLPHEAQGQVLLNYIVTSR